MKKNKIGFTLVELIVVITILAVLATIGFIYFSGNTNKAKKVKLQSNVKNINLVLASKLATGENINSFLTGNLLSENGIDNTLTFNSGAYNLTNTQLKYKVGYLNFYNLQISGEKFKVETNSGKRDYIFSYLKTPDITFHQIAGEVKNESGKNEVIIYGKYYNRANTDAKGLISEKGFDTGLENGQSLTGSLY